MSHDPNMENNLINIGNTESNKITDYIKSISLFNFSILLFISFFGTGLPFQEHSIDIYEAESSNIVNQIVYIFLFISSVLIIIKNPNTFFNFIKKEKYLTLFILFCVISAIWSAYSFLSFKRSFQLVVSFCTIINAVLFLRLELIWALLRYISIFYLLVNYFSGFLIPQAIDPDFGTWRGIELQKNGLGYSALLIFLISLHFYKYKNFFISKIINYSISALSAGLVILSWSSSAIIGLFIVLFLTFIFSFDKIFHALRMGRVLSFSLILFVIVSALIIYVYAPEFLTAIPNAFGKDITMSGRSYYYPFFLDEIQKKFWLGYGYGTYWIMGTDVIDRFYGLYQHRINMAHNGYFEILLQVGFLGFVLFSILTVSFFYRIIVIKDNKTLLLLIAILILNITASIIFQLRSPTTVVFMFGYILVLKTTLISENSS